MKTWPAFSPSRRKRPSASRPEISSYTRWGPSVTGRRKKVEVGGRRCYLFKGQEFYECPNLRLDSLLLWEEQCGMRNSVPHWYATPVV